MDFRFTDAQTLLVNTAREFLRRRCPPPVVEESMASERGFSTELWKEISLLGWPGLLIPLEYGGSGGSLLVVTRGAAGPNLFLLETQRAGVAVVPMTTIAGDRPCEVSFAGVETRADDLLGAAGQGWDLLGPALQAGALARTAEMVGCAQHILELCVEHAKARKQFG